MPSVLPGTRTTHPQIPPSPRWVNRHAPTCRPPRPRRASDSTARSSSRRPSRGPPSSSVASNPPTDVTTGHPRRPRTTSPKHAVPAAQHPPQRRRTIHPKPTTTSSSFPPSPSSATVEVFNPRPARRHRPRLDLERPGGRVLHVRHRLVAAAEASHPHHLVRALSLTAALVLAKTLSLAGRDLPWSIWTIPAYTGTTSRSARRSG